MTFETAQKFILEQVFLAHNSYDSFEIQFMGGEPLLEFPLIQKLAYWIWNEVPLGKKYVLFAQTNGTLLNDEMKSWFASHRDRFFLALSMDGTMEMQNDNRTGSYNIVDTAFFIENWPTQNVKMTISPQTIGKLSIGVKHLHELGFRYIAADLAMGPSLLWSAKDLATYKKELEDLVDYYLTNPDLLPFSMLRLDPTCILYNKCKDIKKTCSCGEDLVCVDWNGKTYACHLFSPISISQEKADKSNQLYDFSNHSQFISAVCRKCMLCIVCNHCYGMNYICTNDVSTSLPFHCNAFKIRFFANCKLYLKYSIQNKDVESYYKISRVINSIKIN